MPKGNPHPELNMLGRAYTRMGEQPKVDTSAPKRLYPLRKHPVQELLKNSEKRFCVVPAGRRSGKTELAKRRLVKKALLCRGYDDANFFAAAPTRDQAKAIYWNDLKAMFPQMCVTDVRESDLSIRLITGTTVHVVGMDKPQRIEGRPWNGGILDEFGNMKRGVWGENVRPALSDRQGWCWLIGVPEGRNHYYEINEYALSGVDEEWESFTWKSADILPASEIAAAKRQLDPLVFQQEYEASFVNFVGRAYYAFDSAENAVAVGLTYDRKADLAFCFDFNVDPGVAVVAQEQRLPGQYERDEGGLVRLDAPVVGTGVIGEVHIPRNSNTVAVCAKLVADWGQHAGEVYCYGDATGGSRGTAQLEGSDWDLIKRELRKHFGDRVNFRVGKDSASRDNPSERARINAMNSRCCDGLGTRRLMVDRTHAPQLVKDMEGVRLLEGGSGEIDKKHDPSLTHMSDALGYYIFREFPVQESTASVSSLRG